MQVESTEKPKKAVPKKTKGSVQGPRKAVRAAILKGKPINCDQLSNSCGASRSTVSKVVKELYEEGLIIKEGRKYKLSSTKGE